MEPMTSYDSILAGNNTTKYHIEYNGFFSNHILQGLVALHRLGATDTQLIQFIDWYKRKLELPSSLEHEQVSASMDVDSLLGERKNYYGLLKYYEDILGKKYNSSLTGFINGEFPKLARGMIASLLHGLIHLGYGFSAGKDWFVCEGMAYLHHSYVPLQLPVDSNNIDIFGSGTKDILEVLESAELRALESFVREERQKSNWREFARGNYQKWICILYTTKGRELTDLVLSIRFPENVDKNNPETLGKWLVDSAISVFVLSTSANDFGLLHGVTSAWSLKLILPHLNQPQAVEAVFYFLCSLLATFSAAGNPVLDRSMLSTDVASMTWNGLIKQVLKFTSTGMNGKEDEHIYKLVQVCKDMRDENDDPNMEKIYKLASFITQNEPLTINREWLQKDP